MVLELYGWASYHLLHDSLDWRECGWDGGFVELVENLRILTTPQQGCIMDPCTTPPPSEVVSMVRHCIPVHYLWKIRNGAPPIGGWIKPTGEAAQFNPYAFEHAYDYMAFRQAGGDYNNTAMDCSKLGHSSANKLYAHFHHSLKHKQMFDLLPPEGMVSGKKKMHYFVQEFAGGELTKINKQAMMNLIDEDAGEVLTKKYSTGDMQLMTKVNLSIPYNGMDLVEFFNTFDSSQATLVEDVTNQVASSAIPIETNQFDLLVSASDSGHVDAIAPSIETPSAMSSPLLISKLPLSAPEQSHDVIGYHG